MKNLLLTLLFVLLLSITVSAQKVYNLDTPKTEKQLIGKSVKTSDTAIYKETSHAVYKSAKGKLFFIYTNKKGNPAKKYVGDV